MHKSLVVFFLLATSSAFAAQDCSKALIPTTTTINTEEFRKLSLAYNLSEGAYDQAKHDASGSAVIYDVPVSASYSDFHESVRKRAESLNLQDFERRSLAYATSSLGDNSLNAYKACLQSNGGFSFVIVKLNVDSYEIELLNSPPPNAPDVLRGRVNLVRNISQDAADAFKRSVADMNFGKVIDGTFTIVPKDPKNEASIDLSIGGGQFTSLALPPIKPTPIRISREMASIYHVIGMRWEPSKSAPEILKESGPESVPVGTIPTVSLCASASPGWSFDRKNVHVRVESVPGHCEPTCPSTNQVLNGSVLSGDACPGSPEEKQICFGARLTVNQGSDTTCKLGLTFEGQEVTTASGR